MPDAQVEPASLAQDFRRAADFENEEERAAWHEELYEPPLSYPVRADHALAQATLGQAHHAAHQANAHATSQAFAQHIAKYEKTGNTHEFSYARELGNSLAPFSCEY
jgi:hypothetical protein